MGKRREMEDFEETRERRRGEPKGNLCESCGETTGSRRFAKGGVEAGIHCDGCWADILDEASRPNW